MTSKEVIKRVCKPGYWFINIGKLGAPPDWKEVPVVPDTSDKLFGYEPKEFLKKQYR